MIVRITLIKFKKITSSDVLMHYDSILPLWLYVFPDQSACLVCFASRTLSKTKCSYSPIDNEAIEILFSVGKFHQFLYGRYLKLICDHKPLISILGKTFAIPQHKANKKQNTQFFCRVILMF